MNSGACQWDLADHSLAGVDADLDHDVNGRGQELMDVGAGEVEEPNRSRRQTGCP